MLLGKRPRPQIKRTKSMSGITVDLNDVESQEPSDQHDPNADLRAITGRENPLPIGHNLETDLMNYNLSFVSPRSHRNHSGLDHSTAASAQFLRTCSLCFRRLSPRRDIYMYRGDTAFCSIECREQQMKQDERKEKCTTGGGSNKDGSRASPSAANPRGSGKSQTVAAA